MEGQLWNVNVLNVVLLNLDFYLKEIKGSSFDELIVKDLTAGAKGLFNLGRIGASKVVKSDWARNRLKAIGKQFLDRLVDSATDDISKKIDPRHGGGRPPNPRGGALDIHKAIGKLP